MTYGGKTVNQHKCVALNKIFAGWQSIQNRKGVKFSKKWYLISTCLPSVLYAYHLAVKLEATDSNWTHMGRRWQLYLKLIKWRKYCRSNETFISVHKDPAEVSFEDERKLNKISTFPHDKGSKVLLLTQVWLFSNMVLIIDFLFYLIFC